MHLLVHQTLNYIQNGKQFAEINIRCYFVILHPTLLQKSIYLYKNPPSTAELRKTIHLLQRRENYKIRDK